MRSGGFCEFSFFFIWHVWNDDAGDACLLAAGKEFLCAVDVDRIEVGHEDERNIDFQSDSFYHVEDLVCRGAGSKGADGRFLDDFPFCHRIGERNTNFNQVAPGLCHDFYIPLGIFQTRVACCQETDECFVPVEGFF